MSHNKLIEARDLESRSPLVTRGDQVTLFRTHTTLNMTDWQTLIYCSAKSNYSGPQNKSLLILWFRLDGDVWVSAISSTFRHTLLLVVGSFCVLFSIISMAFIYCSQICCFKSQFDLYVSCQLDEILKEYRLGDETYMKIRDLLNREMEIGLSKRGNSNAKVKMFVTYVQALPDGSGNCACLNDILLENFIAS